jgi:hypothetical protein
MAVARLTVRATGAVPELSAAQVDAWFSALDRSLGVESGELVAPFAATLELEQSHEAEAAVAAVTAAFHHIGVTTGTFAIELSAPDAPPHVTRTIELTVVAWLARGSAAKLP